MGKRKTSTDGEATKAKLPAIQQPVMPYTIEAVRPSDRTHIGGATLKSLAGVTVEAGVDEAGRGPVLGPMTYGIAVSRIGAEDRLKDLDCHVDIFGVDDSKALTEERRSSIFGEMTSTEEGAAPSFLSFAVRVLPPAHIAACMLRRSKFSLNEISFDAAFGLVQLCLDHGLNITKLFVDTVGPPETYQARLEKRFPGIIIQVSKKADSLFPIVSAASIAAKVTRDDLLERWLDLESGLPATPRGSGYPADPKTKEYIGGMCDRVFGFPSLVRHSWATAQTAMDHKAAPVKWEDDEDMDAKGTLSVASYFGGGKAAAPQHPYFRDRALVSQASF